MDTKKINHTGKTQTQALTPLLVSAHLRYLRMSPTKVRAVADLMRGMGVKEALDQLYFMKRIAKVPLKKLLESAIANAVNNFHLEKENLFIQYITVDGGPMLKRWRARAFGRATQIRKRTSHITIILAEKVPTARKKIKDAKKKEEEVKTVSTEEMKKEGKQDTHDGGLSHGADVKGAKTKGFTKKLFSRKTG